MFAILAEALAFVVTALLAVVALGFALVRWTPLGVRFRQIQNRRRLEARAVLTCPIHGYQSPESLVRLNSGGVLCSLCFKEAMDDVERQ
jgi:hypothetical protein